MQDKAIAFDTETTGLNLHNGHKMFSYATCDARGRVEILRSKDPGYKSGLQKLWKTQRHKVMHNAKFDVIASENELGESLDREKIHCTHKMSHILQNHHHSHSLDHLAWELAGYKRVDHEVKRIAASCGGFHRVPKHIMSKYQKLDVERTMCLYLFFWPKIQSNKKWLDCYQTEMKLIPVTIRMEKRGLMVNRKRTLRMIDELETKVEDARQKAIQIVGRRFNPGSDLQVRRIFYKELGFPVVGRTGKSREPSVDKHALTKLREETKHPLIEEILKYRAYTKGRVTLQSYLGLSHEDILKPTINTCKAITGRQSSENPNLQNVQKTGVLLNPYPVPARKAFRPRPGYVNLHVDYSGIELRLLVEYAKEPELVELISQGGDPHDLAAKVFYQSRYTSAEGARKTSLRGGAKNTNFAIPYGASKVKVGKSLGVSMHAGVKAYNRYARRWPLLANLSKKISRLVKETKEGYVETIFGRRIHIPKNKAYVGTNHLIQCTAGEILKRAEIWIDDWHRTQWGDRVKMLLPIHDELIIEYPRDLLQELPGYLRALRKIMTDFPQLSVPMDIGAEIVTSSWESKKKFEIPA